MTENQQSRKEKAEYRNKAHPHNSAGHRPARRKRQKYRPGYLFLFFFLLLLLFFSVLGAVNLVGSVKKKKAAETETAPNLSYVQQSDPARDNPNLVFSNGRYVDVTKPMVALTFDDGPLSSVGTQILDDFDKVDGRGTFFVVGNRVSRYPDEIKRMASEGHEIGNHSYDHNLKLYTMSIPDIQANFQKTNDAVMQTAGVTPALIRLPGGIESDNMKKALSEPLISWRLDTDDWKTRNAQTTVSKVVGQVKDGDIVLMHELYQPTADACKTIIPELTEEGFQLVTVSEMIRFKNVSVQPGIQYTDFIAKAAG